MSWIVLALLACSGPDPGTLIDELRVVAMVAEPPEVAPGESTDIEVFVADPEENGADILVWACTNLGEGCIESIDSGTYLSVGSPSEGKASVTLEATSALAPALLETDLLEATTIWTLACEPGLCPVIDDSRDLGTDQPWPEALATQLANPMDWMADLPMVGVSLAYRRLSVSENSPEERHANPTITPVFEENLTWKREQKFTLDFTVDGTFSEEARAFNYMTGGGFKTTDTQSFEDTLSLSGFAPEEAGNTDIWVILNDGLGGVAVWFGNAEVQ